MAFEKSAMAQFVLNLVEIHGMFDRVLFQMREDGSGDKYSLVLVPSLVTSALTNDVS